MGSRDVLTVLEFNGTTIRMCRSVRKRSARDITHCFSFKVDDFYRDAQRLIPKQLKDHALKPENLILVLPRYQAMSRTFRLPSQNKEEIKAMMDLALLKELGLGADERAIYAHQMLGFDKEGYALVVVFLMPRERLKFYLDILEKCRLCPMKVTLNTQGLLDWSVLARAPHAETMDRGYFLLNMDHGTFDFTVMARNACVFSRTFSLDPSKRDQAESLLKEIKISREIFRRKGAWGIECEETLYTLGPRKGAVQLLSGPNFWPVKDLYFMDSMGFEPSVKKTIFGSDVSYASVLGISLRASQAAIDITPSEFIASRQKQQRWRAFRRRLAFAGFLFSTAFLIFALYFNAQLKELTRLSEELKAQARFEEALEEIQGALLARQRGSEKKTFSDIFSVLYRSIPPQVFLSDLTLTRQKTLSFKGEGPDPKSAFDYLGSLEKSACFKKCRLESIDASAKEGADVKTRFGITCSL